MSYIQQTLLADEKVIFQQKQHKIVFSSSALYFLIGCFFYMNLINISHTSRIFGFTIQEWVAFGLFFMAAFQFLGAYLSYITSEFAITDKRVLMKTGWIQRTSLEVFLDKIEAINVEQSLLARLFGYGMVVVIGTGGSRDPFYYIVDPLLFRHEVQQQIDQFGRQKKADDAS